MEKEVRSLTQEIVESEKKALKARFGVLKSFPEEIANEHLAMDIELDDYLKDYLELYIHNGFVSLGGVLEFDENSGFKVVKADIKNKKFKFEYKGKLYASLKLIHMLTNNNEEIKKRERDIMSMIDNYYIISQNIPFSFDSTGNITKEYSLAVNVQRWKTGAEFNAGQNNATEEELLNVLDKYANTAIKYLINSIEKAAQDELEFLLS